MENITSKIDTELCRNYKNVSSRFDSDSDDDMYGGNKKQIAAGSVIAGNHTDKMLFCKCIQLSAPHSDNFKYVFRTMMWDEPNVMRDGYTAKNSIWDDVKDCNDIKDIINKGNNFMKYYGGASKTKRRSESSCATDAISVLNQEANKVLNYIYSNYKDTETTQPITEAMIANAMQSVKLNVLHTDLPRLFEYVISKHKKGLGKKDYVEHPLSYVLCHMRELINPIIAFEKSIEGYSYLELLNNLRLQGSEYDADLLETLPMKFDVSTMIHPLFVAMFWRQLPLVENMCVDSDQFQLLKNIHASQENIRPSSYNFDLTTARWNEKNPIAFFGVTNVIDTEIKRVLCHVYLKKIIYKLRTGEVYSVDSNKLISWLQKVFIFNSYDNGDDAEQLITAFFNLFLIRPIKLFVQDQLAINGNCSYMMNTPMDEYMKECPFIYCETVNPVGGTVYNFMPVELNCMRYDKIKNKAILNLNALTNTRQVIVTGNCQPALTCNGILPIFTRRKTQLNFRDIASIKIDDHHEYINVSHLNVQSEYIIDNKTYRLTSALCYHTIKPEGSLMTDKEIASGYYALVKSNEGWLNYNTNSFTGSKNIDDLRKKFIDTFRNTYEPVRVLDPNNPGVTISYPDAFLEERFINKFGNGVVDTKLFIISNTEAMDMINTHSCLLIYSEDYDTYKTNMNRNRFL